MTLFKHIITLVLVLLFFGMAAQAQSSALNPYEGASHTYAWNGLQQGLDYNFYITDNANGSGLYDDAVTGEFDFIDITTGKVGANNKASTAIVWNNGASLNVYYLWIEAISQDGCSNYRYVQITPQTSAFDLVAENMPVSNTVSCPETANGFNPMASGYSAGITELQFKVRRENGTPNPLATGNTYDWSFIPNLTVDPNLAEHINVVVSVEEATKAGERYTVSGAYSEVIVTVSIQNAPGYNLDVTLLVSGQQESNTNLSDSNPSNDQVTHTIQVMPLIGGMGGV